MRNLVSKRDLLTGAIGLGLASGVAYAQSAPQPAAAPARINAEDTPRRVAKTTKLFKAPGLYPNALALAPEGLWIGQQKISDDQARQWGQTPPADRDEDAWLVDWNGKLLKTVRTQSRNTSGMAYGGGYIWMCANTTPNGVFQTDMNSKLVSHKQIPLGGGGCHGAQWREGKLWICANRMGNLLRVDPATWIPDFAIPIARSATQPRYHDFTFDAQGNVWQIIGNNSTSYAAGKHGLVKYDPTGKVLEYVDLAPGSCDPHGLEFYNGKLISCDAGVHPGWGDKDSPSTGYIFSIDL